MNPLIKKSSIAGLAVGVGSIIYSGVAWGKSSPETNNSVPKETSIPDPITKQVDQKVQEVERVEEKVVEQTEITENYTYNPPQFTNENNLSHGCYRNLFKDLTIANNRTYGCLVMKAESQSSNKKSMLYSELAIRKGNQGLVVSSKLDQIADSMSLDYMVSKLTLNNGSWAKEIMYIKNKSRKDSRAAYSRKINITSPNHNFQISKDNSTETISDVWVFDDQITTTQNIFDKIGITYDHSWKREKPYSFLHQEHDGNSLKINYYKLSDTSPDDKWQNAEKNGTQITYIYDSIEKGEEWIEPFKNITGRWAKLNTVCSGSQEDKSGNKQIYCFSKNN